MALDPRILAALALHRFGLGPRAGSIAAIASDPRAAVLAELDAPQAGQIDGSELMGAAQASRALFEFNAERRANDRRERKRRETEKQRTAEAGMDAPAMPAAPAASDDAAAPKPDAVPPLPRRIFLQEAQARL